MMDSARKGKGAGRKVSEGETRRGGGRADGPTSGAPRGGDQRLPKDETGRKNRRRGTLGTRGTRGTGVRATRTCATWHGYARAREVSGRLVRRDAGLARPGRDRDAWHFRSIPGDGSGRGVGTLTNSLRDVRLGDLLLAQAPVEVRGNPDGPEGTALREDVLRVELWRRTTSPRFRPTQPRRNLTPKNGRWTLPRRATRTRVRNAGGRHSTTRDEREMRAREPVSVRRARSGVPSRASDAPRESSAHFSRNSSVNGVFPLFGSYTENVWHF